jgi:hypothetical protein
MYEMGRKRVYSEEDIHKFAKMTSIEKAALEP